MASLQKHLLIQLLEFGVISTFTINLIKTQEDSQGMKVMQLQHFSVEWLLVLLPILLILFLQECKLINFIQNKQEEITEMFLMVFTKLWKKDPYSEGQWQMDLELQLYLGQ
jgi:hypothetical protein